jgi:hypothetical protein
MTQSNKKNRVKVVTKKVPIQSFIYYAQKPPQAEVKPLEITPSTKKLSIESLPTKNEIAENKELKPKAIEKVIKKPSVKTNNLDITKKTELPKVPPKTLQSTVLPTPSAGKIDSFKQLQRLRSRLNQRAANSVDMPNQGYQTPSIFNTKVKPVPHSSPLKDEEKEREKNTKNMGGGIAITKGDDGTCSITQDMSVYGLSEGSSTQFFSCGESKFDQSFREHMKKVKAKIGKN